MCDSSRDTFVFALSPFLTSKELKKKGKTKIEESNRGEKKAAAAGMLHWSICSKSKITTDKMTK